MKRLSEALLRIKRAPAPYVARAKNPAVALQSAAHHRRPGQESSGGFAERSEPPSWGHRFSALSAMRQRHTNAAGVRMVMPVAAATSKPTKICGQLDKTRGRLRACVCVFVSECVSLCL